MLNPRVPLRDVQAAVIVEPQPRDRMRLSPQPLRVALIGTRLPRKCGLATFSGDVAASILAASPDAIVDHWQVRSPDEAAVDDSFMLEGDVESFAAAAREVERRGTGVVLLQHEFGLFGGPAGDAILAFVRASAVPLVVAFHTILDEPDADQRRVMDVLVARASTMVVMSERSRRVLIDLYGADPKRVVLIEHGVPDRPFGRSEQFKRAWGFHGRVMLTFGLLSPGKGIETAIEALPAIVAADPNVTYCIAGATHPHLLAREGEAYREQLKALARTLNVEGHIRWIDSFLETSELLDLIEAADIYLTPYPGAAQSTSGTLSYAVALGKAVISTPYLHACELLSDGTGIIVPFGDARAIAREAITLLEAPDALYALQHRAYQRGRVMTWDHYGARLMDVMEGARVPGRDKPSIVRNAQSLPLQGLLRLCDDCGMMQHSKGLIPDRNHGYCIDDNARALMLFNRLPKDNAGLVDRYTAHFAAFVDHGWNDSLARFRNFMGYARNWLEDEGSEDSNGRTLWALGCTASEGRNPDLREWAAALYDRVAKHAGHWSSPRATAFVMLAAAARLDRMPNHPASLTLLKDGLQRLTLLLDGARRPDWPWFEVVLAYDNPRLPEAMIRAGQILGDRAAIATGLETLRWICGQQQSLAGTFRPVGSDSFGRERARALPFDQQPVEAWAMIDACVAAFAVDRDMHWIRTAWSAYDWFLGGNDRGEPLAEPTMGTCRDGLTPTGINMNSGAESVLAFHFANLAIRSLPNPIN